MQSILNEELVPASFDILTMQSFSYRLNMKPNSAKYDKINVCLLGDKIFT